MRRLRLALCALLGLVAAGHFTGTFLFYPAGSEVFVWSLSGGVLALAVIVLNLVAMSGERAHLAAAGLFSLAWAGLALGFGLAIDAPADPRVLMHVLVALALVVLDGAALAGRSRQPVAS
jgi:hypothetical protein